MCRLSATCSKLTIADYATEEIIVLVVGSILHIPLWCAVLYWVDALKAGARTSDVFSFGRKVNFSYVGQNDRSFNCGFRHFRKLQQFRTRRARIQSRATGARESAVRRATTKTPTCAGKGTG